jgi:hypothetical protein
MRILELFSGTHSIGKVAKKKGYEIISLDRDLDSSYDGYVSDHHIKKDIMDWDYTVFDVGHFDIISASPVCLWWSSLRNCWIGRKCKAIHPTDIITKEHLEEQINIYGKPMVDKIFEIIEYFQPKYWWIENPATGRMKHYIKDQYPEYNTFYDVDYCKYSNWGYKKKTRFWTNIKNFEPKICKNDCENMVLINKQKIHKKRMGTSKTVLDNGKIIRVNTKALIQKYKDYDNVELLHKTVLGNVYELIDGVKTLCNIKELRSKLKNKKDKTVSLGSKTTKLERYRIPEKLVISLFNSIHDN